MDLARLEGAQVKETRINLSELGKFEACFLTGTSPKVLPVSGFDGHRFDVNNSIMRKLMQAYDDLVAREVRNFCW